MSTQDKDVMGVAPAAPGSLFQAALSTSIPNAGVGCAECGWGKVAGCWRCGSRLAYPRPETQIVGKCSWVHGKENSYLVDEAGTVWQTHWRGGPHDEWAGSVQRHETCGDNY